MQIILWHDLKAGRKMRWTRAMRESADTPTAADIGASMKASLAAADEDQRED